RFNLRDTDDFAIDICHSAGEGIHEVAFIESDGPAQFILRRCGYYGRARIRFRYGIESMKRITYYVLPIVLISIVCLRPALGQTIELAPVVTRPLSRTIDLPGEFQPFLSVALHAKVTGYVEKVLVDRGSVVKEGQLLVQLTAPEMKAQIAEADAKLQSAEA